MRIGQGFDVHKFGGEGPLVIGGVSIPHPQGFLAHSDGDVLLHAIMDALLGAIGEGDIGVWFPDNDPRYQGMDSKVLTTTVVDHVEHLGYRLMNIDVTVICERPKINPYRQAIKDSIAQVLRTNPSRVNVKASTHEKLGAIGRQEGVVALAVVLLESIA